MKKYKKIMYIILIVIIAVLSIVIYNNISKANDNSKEEKNYEEIQFLEEKLVELFNNMNNIEARNYSVAVTKITKETEKQNETSSGNTSENKEESSNSDSENSEEKNSSTENSSKENNNETENSEKYSLENNGVLLNSEEINWDNIESQVETLYTSIPTITIDLYQSNLNQNNILEFNKAFDDLTVKVKEKNKEDTLAVLSNLYKYVNDFTQEAVNDDLYKATVEAKLNIFYAYSKLDSKNWNEISNDITNAINSYSKLLSNEKIDSTKQYGVNKIYVMINELQNSSNVQDESVFLIKYKNILEEMNSVY